MNGLATTTTLGMFPAIWKLIRLRFVINWNSFTHAKLRRKIVTIVITTLALGFAVFIFILSWWLLGFLHSPRLTEYVGFDVTPFLQAVPVLILAMLFLGILFSSFGVLLQALYLSGDMDFLLSSPVPIRAVFITKMLQAVLPNFGLIALFGLPVLFGLGLSGHYNFLYFPLVLLIMVALTLAAAGLSALLVMLVARIFPPRRVAEVLGFLTGAISILCSQSGNFYNATRGSVNISGSQVNSMFALLMRLDTPWNPLNWAGTGLVKLGEGAWLPGLGLVVLTLAGCGLAFTFALVTAERWYYSGWAGMQVVSQKKKAHHAKPQSTHHTQIQNATATTSRKRLLPAPVRAIMRKDFLTMRRDIRNMSHLVTPLIFGVFYTFLFLRPGNSMFSGGEDMPAFFSSIVSLISVYGNIGMALFVGWMLLARLSGMAFSAEGKNYWMLKSSPVKPGDMLVAKFLVGYLPTITLGVIFMVAVSIIQKASLLTFLYGLLATAMCQAGMDGILLAFSVAGANFTWTDPRRMNAGATGCLGQALTGLFLPISFSVFVGPLLLASFFHWSQVIGYIIGGIAGSAVSLTCTVLPPYLVQKRVERLAEN